MEDGKRTEIHKNKGLNKIPSSSQIYCPCRMRLRKFNNLKKRIQIKMHFYAGAIVRNESIKFGTADNKLMTGSIRL